MADKLTPQQELFCQEYLKDINATAAAKRAGYSEKTAHSQGPRLLDNVEVQARIQKLMNDRAKRISVTADFVLGELLKLASVDLALAYDEQGHLKPIHEIPEDVRKAIAGVKVFDEFEGFGKDRVKVGEVREVKFWDKPKVLEMLGRHLKLFTDRVEHSFSKGLSEKLAEARKRRGGNK